jgi:hypothetical protein
VTFSDAWVDTVDDDDFAALIQAQSTIDAKRADRLYLLPSPPPRAGEYWINVVKEWAVAHGLPIESFGPLEISVPVSRAQLLQFLDDVFGPEAATMPLCRHVREHLRDDRQYLVTSDEF